eukprot:7372277-Heterocapsa_arctica.AAC.1
MRAAPCCGSRPCAALSAGSAGRSGWLGCCRRRAALREVRSIVPEGERPELSKALCAPLRRRWLRRRSLA